MTKIVHCSKCNSGWVTCNWCNGSGYDKSTNLYTPEDARCSHCGGNGVTSCTNCSGTGEITVYEADNSSNYSNSDINYKSSASSSLGTGSSTSESSYGSSNHSDYSSVNLKRAYAQANAELREDFIKRNTIPALIGFVIGWLFFNNVGSFSTLLISGLIGAALAMGVYHFISNLFTSDNKIYKTLRIIGIVIIILFVLSKFM